MKRVITALFLIPLFAYLIVWSPPWLFLTAVAAVANCVRERDRLIDAYVSRIRTYLLRKCTSSQLPVLEAAIRAHLCGEST